MKIREITFLLFIPFIFSSCSQKTETEVKTATDKEIAEKQLKPANLISLEEAKEQIDNYRGAHPKEVGDHYALRTWISIDELKAYIQYVEDESKAKGIEVSGIDFIHTQHKKGNPGDENPENTTYDLTLMMAPTFEDGNMQTAFDPIYSEQGEPKSLESLFKEMTVIDAEKADTRPKASSIANNMASCPNMCAQN